MIQYPTATAAAATGMPAFGGGMHSIASPQRTPQSQAERGSILSPDRGAQSDPDSVINFCEDVGPVFREWVENSGGEANRDRCALCRRARPSLQPGAFAAGTAYVPGMPVTTHSQLVDKLQTQGFVVYDGVPHCLSCAKRLLHDVLQPHFRSAQGHSGEVIAEQIAKIDNLSGFRPRLDQLELITAASVGRAESDTLFEALSFQLFRSRPLGQLLRLVVCDAALSQQAILQAFLFTSSSALGGAGGSDSAGGLLRARALNAPSAATQSSTSAYFRDPALPSPIPSMFASPPSSMMDAENMSAASHSHRRKYADGGGIGDEYAVLAAESARFVQYLAECSEPGSPCPLRFVPMVARVVASLFGCNVHLIDPDRIVENGRWHTMFAAPQQQQQQQQQGAAVKAPPPADVFIVASTAEAGGVLRRYHSLVALPSDTHDVSIPYMRWLKVSSGAPETDVTGGTTAYGRSVQEGNGNGGDGGGGGGDDDDDVARADGVSPSTRSRSRGGGGWSPSSALTPMSSQQLLQQQQQQLNSSRQPSAARSADGATQTGPLIEQIYFVADVPKMPPQLLAGSDSDGDAANAGGNGRGNSPRGLPAIPADLDSTRHPSSAAMRHNQEFDAFVRARRAAAGIRGDSIGVDDVNAPRFHTSKLLFRFGSSGSCLGVSSFMQPTLVDGVKLNSTSGGGSDSERLANCVFQAAPASDAPANNSAIRFGQACRLLHSATGLYLTLCTDGRAFWLSFSSASGDHDGGGAVQQSALWTITAADASGGGAAAGGCVSNLALVFIDSVLAPGAFQRALSIAQHETSPRAVTLRPRSGETVSRCVCRVVMKPPSASAVPQQIAASSTTATSGSLSGRGGAPAMVGLLPPSLAAVDDRDDAFVQISFSAPVALHLQNRGEGGAAPRRLLAIDAASRSVAPSRHGASPDTFFRVEQCASAAETPHGLALFRIIGFNGKTEVVVASRAETRRKQRAEAEGDDIDTAAPAADHGDRGGDDADDDQSVVAVLRADEDRLRQRRITPLLRGWHLVSATRPQQQQQQQQAMQGAEGLCYLVWSDGGGRGVGQPRLAFAVPGASDAGGVGVSSTFDIGAVACVSLVPEPVLRRLRAVRGLSQSAEQLVATAGGGGAGTDSMMRVLATTVSGALADTVIPALRGGDPRAAMLSYVLKSGLCETVMRVVSAIVPPHRVAIAAAATKQDAAAAAAAAPVEVPDLYQAVAIAIDRSAGVARELAQVLARCFEFLRVVFRSDQQAEQQQQRRSSLGVCSVLPSHHDLDDGNSGGGGRDGSEEAQLLSQLRTAQLARFAVQYCMLGDLGATAFALAVLEQTAAFTPDEIKELIHGAVALTEGAEAAADGALFQGVFEVLAALVMCRGNALRVPQSIVGALLLRATHADKLFTLSRSSSSANNVTVSIPGVAGRRQVVIPITELVAKAQRDGNAHAKAALLSLAAQLDLFTALVSGAATAGDDGSSSGNVTAVMQLVPQMVLEILAGFHDGDDTAGQHALVDDSVRAAAVRLYLHLYVLAPASATVRRHQQQQRQLIARGAVVIRAERSSSSFGSGAQFDLDIDSWRDALHNADEALRPLARDQSKNFLASLDFWFIHACKVVARAGWQLVHPSRTAPSRTVAACIDCFTFLVAAHLLPEDSCNSVVEICVVGGTALADDPSSPSPPPSPSRAGATTTVAAVTNSSNAAYAECCDATADLLAAAIDMSIVRCAVNDVVPSFAAFLAQRRSGGASPARGAVVAVPPPSDNDSDDDRQQPPQPAAVTTGARSAEPLDDAGGASGSSKLGRAIAESSKKYQVLGEQPDAAAEADAPQQASSSSSPPRPAAAGFRGVSDLVARIHNRRHSSSSAAIAEALLRVTIRLSSPRFFRLLCRWGAFALDAADALSRLRIAVGSAGTATPGAASSAFTPAQRQHIAAVADAWRTFVADARSAAAAESGSVAGRLLCRQPRGARAVNAVVRDAAQLFGAELRGAGPVAVVKTALAHFFDLSQQRGVGAVCGCEAVSAARLLLEQWREWLSPTALSSAASGASGTAATTAIAQAAQMVELCDSVSLARVLLRRCAVATARAMFRDDAFLGACIRLCNDALSRGASSASAAAAAADGASHGPAAMLARSAEVMRESAVLLLADAVVCGCAPADGTLSGSPRAVHLAALDSLVSVLRLAEPAGDASVEVQAALSALLALLQLPHVAAEAVGAVDLACVLRRLLAVLESSPRSLPHEARTAFGRVHELVALIAARLAQQMQASCAGGVSASSAPLPLPQSSLVAIVRHTASQRARTVALALLMQSCDCDCMAPTCAALPHQVADTLAQLQQQQPKQLWKAVRVADGLVVVCTPEAEETNAPQEPRDSDSRRLRDRQAVAAMLEPLSVAERHVVTAQFEEDFAERLGRHIDPAAPEADERESDVKNGDNAASASADDASSGFDDSTFGTLHRVSYVLSSLLVLVIVIVLLADPDSHHAGQRGYLEPATPSETVVWALAIANIVFEACGLLFVIGGVCTLGVPALETSDAAVRIVAAASYAALAALAFSVSPVFHAMSLVPRLAALVPAALSACSASHGVGFVALSRTRSIATVIAGLLPIALVAFAAALGVLLVFSFIAFFETDAGAWFAIADAQSAGNLTASTAVYRQPCPTTLSACFINVVFLALGSKPSLNSAGNSTAAVTTGLSAIMLTGADMTTRAQWSRVHLWMMLDVVTVVSIVIIVLTHFALAIQQMAENGRAAEQRARELRERQFLEETEHVPSPQRVRGNVEKLRLAQSIAAVDPAERTPAEEAMMRKLLAKC